MRRRRPARLAGAVAVACVASLLAGCSAGAPASGTAQAISGAVTVPTVLNADGTVDATAYRRLAGSLATATGVAYRFGNPATTARSTGTVWQPSSKDFRDAQSTVQRTYQIGGPQNAAKNDYSSDQGQVGYVATGSSPSVGVDAIETLNMAENTFSERPQKSWTYYGAGHPDPDVVAAPQDATGKCLAKLGARPGRFVAQARAYAHGEATANTILAFDNGVILGAGTNTARGAACTKLPSYLHPSAVSVTNGNEFAIITAWNTRTLQSDLVVIALAGAEKAGDFWGFDWTRLYPGLRNYGRPTFMKVLGWIPLPIAAATGVSAVSDTSSSAPFTRVGGGASQLGDLALTTEANRQSFISGANKAAVATAGYAVVTSREEKKVVFVDLQPLFATITARYFGSKASFDSAIDNVGLGATKWPYAFSVAPKEQPVVVKTVSLASSPTAAAAMLSGAHTPRAYVATENGLLHTFAVGGLASSAAASASAIRAVGTVRVGLNPTDITYVKDRATGDAIKQTLDNTLIVTARGSREVQWVHLAGNSGSVIRTLRDSRLVDPIAAEDDNTHGTESYVVTIADYAAGRVRNYRYGPVIFHTNGGAAFGVGPSGHSAFEYGGAYAPGGHPYSISVTNVD